MLMWLSFGVAIASAVPVQTPNLIDRCHLTVPIDMRDMDGLITENVLRIRMKGVLAELGEGLTDEPAFTPQEGVAPVQSVYVLPPGAWSDDFMQSWPNPAPKLAVEELLKQLLSKLKERDIALSELQATQKLITAKCKKIQEVLQQKDLMAEEDVRKTFTSWKQQFLAFAQLATERLDALELAAAKQVDCGACCLDCLWFWFCCGCCRE